MTRCRPAPVQQKCVTGSPCMLENTSLLKRALPQALSNYRLRSLFQTPSWLNSPLQPRLLKQQVRSPTPFGWAPKPPFACKRSNANLIKHSSPSLSDCSHPRVTKIRQSYGPARFTYLTYGTVRKPSMKDHNSCTSMILGGNPKSENY